MTRAPQRRSFALLGSTGSVGVSTLALVERFPERFRAVALAAGRNTAVLAEQVRRHAPALVSVADEASARDLHARVPEFAGRILVGSDGALAVATHAEADLVLSALVGALGLVPTLAAVHAGKHVALANKEVLVVAGELVTSAARERGVSLLPVDSEHNAIFQALRGQNRDEVKRIVLTASGGPFLSRSAAELANVTVAEALDHPTWKMGPKITIDSATLMNKGLEVIEARWLFDVGADRIDVVIHPQSIVHSMVEYVDGSVLAQMAVPDMTIPIGYALAYPSRLPLDYLRPLDLPAAGTLTFAAPDRQRFPCLDLAYRALRAGGTMPAVLNAANEVAVERFLAEDLAYGEIPALVGAVMDAHAPAAASDLDVLLAADAWARAAARSGSGRAGRTAATAGPR
ncbi:MAG: 1-deoxy-D-xylulose-5-phosphate reductoisomerase [Polyangiaceae bacterium UTPRO1]|nr:1-deoxy-D-xylulose-5-phosphate reductoisomerase [Myxococcales bacterium]OQY66820.1 MAG: 1-deoxy-D-xylulose-5-phosphate reductoisomerase [Polyangiaceae bacterium UTPRO1]